MAEHRTGARRAFLTMLTAGLGAVAGALAVIPGLGFLSSPLRRATVRGSGKPLRVAADPDVKPGKPLRVTMVGQHHDAWLRLEKVVLGSCWLVRTGEGGPIKAFSTVCPHLGCGVDWNDKTEKFDCPCHASSFDVDGRCLGGPAPRGLDELEVRVEGKDVLVRHERFLSGSAKKEPIG